MSGRPSPRIAADMLSAIRKILAYSVDFDPKQESGDCRTREAILYNLQVIGEAAARLP